MSASTADRPEHLSAGVAPAVSSGPKRKILHVITRLIPGGADENTYLSAAGMDGRRYEVDLAVGRASEPASFVFPLHMRLVVIPHLVREIHPANDLVALVELMRLMRRERYDLVHTHTAKAGVLGRLAAALMHVPHVVHTYHGLTFHPGMPGPRRALYIAAERAAAALTHRFIAVGEEVRAGYEEAGVVGPLRCEVIYSGMDLGRFKRAANLRAGEMTALRRELGLPPDAVIACVVSRLEARKGHSYLLAAMAELAPEFPRLHFAIAGAGPLRESLMDRVATHGLTARVHFLGHRTDVERVMAAADIIALTSNLEGLPRVLVQAAAAGKPILAFAAPGVREVVVHGHNGYVVPVADERGLTAYLRRMLLDPEATREMGRRGQELIDERWSESTMVSQINTVYEELWRAA